MTILVVTVLWMAHPTFDLPKKPESEAAGEGIYGILGEESVLPINFPSLIAHLKLRRFQAHKVRDWGSKQCKRAVDKGHV